MTDSAAMTHSNPMGRASALPPPPTPENLKAAPQSTASDFAGLHLPLVVAAWPKNGRDTIQVQLDRYQGRETIDIRCWYSGQDGELKPGKGFTASIKHLPALAAGMAKALAAAQAAGLLSEGGDQ